MFSDNASRPASMRTSATVNRLFLTSTNTVGHVRPNHQSQNACRPTKSDDMAGAAALPGRVENSIDARRSSLASHARRPGQQPGRRSTPGTNRRRRGHVRTPAAQSKTAAGLPSMPRCALGGKPRRAGKGKSGRVHRCCRLRRHLRARPTDLITAQDDRPTHGGIAGTPAGTVARTTRTPR